MDIKLPQDTLEAYVTARKQVDDSALTISCLAGLLGSFEQISDDEIQISADVLGRIGKIMETEAHRILEALDDFLPLPKIQQESID